jgi:hypothetical protein
MEVAMATSDQKPGDGHGNGDHGDHNGKNGNDDKEKIICCPPPFEEKEAIKVYSVSTNALQNFDLKIEKKQGEWLLLSGMTILPGNVARAWVRLASCGEYTTFFWVSVPKGT